MFCFFFFFFFLSPSFLTVASWFLSPLLSGLMSAVLFYFVRMFILQKVRTGNLSLLALPLRVVSKVELM